MSLWYTWNTSRILLSILRTVQTESSIQIMIGNISLLGESIPLLQRLLTSGNHWILFPFANLLCSAWVPKSGGWNGQVERVGLRAGGCSLQLGTVGSRLGASCVRFSQRESTGRNSVCNLTTSSVLTRKIGLFCQCTVTRAVDFCITAYAYETELPLGVAADLNCLGSVSYPLVILCLAKRTVNRT